MRTAGEADQEKAVLVVGNSNNVSAVIDAVGLGGSDANGRQFLHSVRLIPNKRMIIKIRI